MTDRSGLTRHLALKGAEAPKGSRRTVNYKRARKTRDAWEGSGVPETGWGFQAECVRNGLRVSHVVEVFDSEARTPEGEPGGRD